MPETYDTGSEVLAIETIEGGLDGSWTLMFANDDVITLGSFSERSMGWYSHASGDAFASSRIGK